LSALAKFLTGDENASLKIPHGAYSFPLPPIFAEDELNSLKKNCKFGVKNESREEK
jgi:hypothetical protein